MKTINRTVLTISPKQPYIDWANSFEDGGPKMDGDTMRSTAFLIPNEYDEYTYEKFLEKVYSNIFETKRISDSRFRTGNSGVQIRLHEAVA